MKGSVFLYFRLKKSIHLILNIYVSISVHCKNTTLLFKFKFSLILFHHITYRVACHLKNNLSSRHILFSYGLISKSACRYLYYALLALDQKYFHTFHSSRRLSQRHSHYLFSGFHSFQTIWCCIRWLDLWVHLQIFFHVLYWEYVFYLTVYLMLLTWWPKSFLQIVHELEEVFYSLTLFPSYLTSLFQPLYLFLNIFPFYLDQ